jgi:hypothetical protein
MVMQPDARMGKKRKPSMRIPKNSTRVTVSLPRESYETVVRMAKNKRVSTAWVIRDAVEKYLVADIPLLANQITQPAP